MAAAMAAIQGANVAAIASQSFRGYAFGGDMTVSGTGGTDSQLVAFRATPGERVSISTPAQDRARSGGSGGEGGRSEGGTRVINVIDPSMLQDYLDSPSGERTLLNVMSRNRGRVSALVNG